jgi:NAD(P)-dependent dehydrogenase (short-subunit alcohol dehydrogenase family)
MCPRRSVTYPDAVSSSYVVTGGGRGVGRAIAERLAADGGTVVIVELDETALDWVSGHAAASRLSGVTGSASDEGTAQAAADLAEKAAPLAGWVNNAALFRDAALHTASPAQVMELIAANVAPVVTGCAVAVGRFLPRAGAGRS